MIFCCPALSPYMSLTTQVAKKEGYQTLMNIVMSEAYFANSFVFLLCGTIYLLNSFHYKASAAETTRQIAATPAPVLGIRDG